MNIMLINAFMTFLPATPEKCLPPRNSEPASRGTRSNQPRDPPEPLPWCLVPRLPPVTRHCCHRRLHVEHIVSDSKHAFTALGHILYNILYII